MVIEVREHVPQCNTYDEGLRISALIRESFRHDHDIVLSFSAIKDVPSSFINGALVSLLDEFSYEYIRNHLYIDNSTRQINDMIKRCFSAARKRMPPAEAQCA